jgi:hypothetical protein
MTSLAGLRLSHALIACTALFCAVTVPGLLFDGMNPDDWRQLDGAPVGGMPLNWTTEEGRWAMELLFVTVLGERFLPGVQALLALCTLGWISHTLARASSPAPLVPMAMVALFAVATNHIYMVDALSFSSHVFAFPLAMACSLYGFLLFLKTAQTGLSTATFLRFALAVQLLAISAGIYQPFAPFGAVLLAIAFVRVDRFAPGALIRITLVSVLGASLGIVLYVIEWRLATGLSAHVAEVERFPSPGLAEILGKLRALPGLLHSIHSGGLQAIPQVLRMANAALLLAIALLTLWATGRQIAQGRDWAAVLGAARIGAGVGIALFVLPTLVWFTYTNLWMPGRVSAYVPFVSGAILLTLASLLSIGSGTRLRDAVLIAMGGLGLLNGFIAAAAWSDQITTGRRDEEMARAIFARVSATPGYDGGPIRIVGGLRYPDLSWGGHLGWTVLHAGNPVPGIFKQMFGLDWYAEFYAESPQACPAFPAEASVFAESGHIYACLWPTSGLPSLRDCQPVGDGRVCRTDAALIWIRADCTSLRFAGADTRFVLKQSLTGRRVVLHFTGEHRGIGRDDGCYFAQTLPFDEIGEVGVERRDPAGGDTWEEIATLDWPSR